MVSWDTVYTTFEFPLLVKKCFKKRHKNSNLSKEARLELIKVSHHVAALAISHSRKLLQRDMRIVVQMKLANKLRFSKSVLFDDDFL